MEQLVPQIPDEQELAPENEDQLVPEYEPQVVPEQAPRVLPEISMEDWTQLFQKGKFKKREMDIMVMSYFLDKELPHVAEAFQRELGSPGTTTLLLFCSVLHPLNLQWNSIKYITKIFTFNVVIASHAHYYSMVGAQKIVRDLILNRQFDDAIQTLNQKMYPEFLECRPRLHFYLDQLKMIEFCRIGDINEALKFSRRFIMWESFETEIDPDFKFGKECRRTLLLMLYEDTQESPVSDLYRYARRVWIANHVVDSMIYCQYRTKGNYIDTALKMLKLEEKELEKVVRFPWFNQDSGYPDSS